VPRREGFPRARPARK
jgi:hypothetical protein